MTRLLIGFSLAALHNRPVLVATLVLVGALVLLSPQDRARAADSVVIRTHLNDSGNVIIERQYHMPTRWVTVGVITLGQLDDVGVFQHGSFTLSVEFIPEARWPLPSGGGWSSESVPRIRCSKFNDEGRCIFAEGGWHRVTTVYCDWGFSAVLGPYESLATSVMDGAWAMPICDHGDLLKPGGLQSPAEMITLDQLKAMVAAALAAVGETRPIEDIPQPKAVFHSETTYIDFRVMSVEGEEAPSLTVQARGGGKQQVLKLDQVATIAIYSLEP